MVEIILLDLRNALLNIAIHKSSRYITTFFHDKRYWRFKYLPFGFSIVPFFMQLVGNYIAKAFVEKGCFAWIHLDDLISSHNDANFLKQVLDSVMDRLIQSSI